MSQTQNAPHLDEPPITIGGREQLFNLLAEASEIEHTLMCSYLFAAFSLRSGPDSGLSAAEAAAVSRWRASIIGVAVEEMAHLLLVANLSIAIGGRPHFGRPNFPVEPGYFPADVVVRLTAFSRETLDHFVFLERPKIAAVGDGAGFEPSADYVREAAFARLMPSLQDYATVGRLYEAISANLSACAKTIGEAALFIGPVSAQVGADVVDLAGISVISDLASAHAAIEAIVEQGEGSASDRDGSHYHRFCAIREEYEALLGANPTFDPAWPVAESPVMWRPPTAEGKTFIAGWPAAAVLDLGNAVYGLLLQLIVQAFGRSGPDAAAAQRRAISGAIDLMHALSKVADSLVRLPAGPDCPGRTAGLSFTMARAVEPLFTGAAEAALVNERLSDLVAGARRVEDLAPGLEGVADAIAQASASYAGDDFARSQDRRHGVD